MLAISLVGIVQKSGCHMRGEITTLWHRTKFNFQPYAGGENNFPLLESWVDQRVMIQEQDTTTFWA